MPFLLIDDEFCGKLSNSNDNDDNVHATESSLNRSIVTNLGLHSQCLLCDINHVAIAICKSNNFRIPGGSVGA